MTKYKLKSPHTQKIHMYFQIKIPFQLAFVVSNQSIKQCKTTVGDTPQFCAKKKIFPTGTPFRWIPTMTPGSYSYKPLLHPLQPLPRATQLWISTLPLFPLCPPWPIMPIWHQWLINPISLHLPLYISLFCISGIYWSRIVQYWQHIKLKPFVHEKIYIGKNLERKMMVGNAYKKSACYTNLFAICLWLNHGKNAGRILL